MPQNILGNRQSNWMSDLAYALKVRECPQVLFLHGNRIVYRERGWTMIFVILLSRDFICFKAGNPQASSLLKMMETYTLRAETWCRYQPSNAYQRKYSGNIYTICGSLNFDALKTLIAGTINEIKSWEGQWKLPLTHVNVCGSSLRLKHLHISFCKYIKSIEVYAPNLVSFEYRVLERVHIDLMYVPQLCDVSYAGRWESRRVFELRKSIPSCLATSQLVNLLLRIPFLPFVLDVVEPRIPIEEKYVKRIIRMGRELGVTPLNKKLMMLREVEIVGFVRAVADSILVCFVSLVAPNLDKIVINCCLPHWHRGAPVDDRKIKELEKGKRLVCDMLSAIRPEGSKYTLL
ncbi:hypothetical protein V6N13_002773 [Hibiscus sabdariffa]